MNSQFQQQILTTVAAIPAGFVASYGDIAQLAGLSNQARLVGAVLKKLPANSAIPWHRVINSRGQISLPLDSDGYRRQKALLEDEGLIIQSQNVLWQGKRWQPQ
ncbi:DNA base-flipping protein [Sinobacterium norvegicum]|uniref:DNA base-flipping protein n=1 Tax=Sinobacterium norvegicum TaxID=1641715 RepID=A0ABM9ADT8_9GAMM|nr:methylated-DNA--[protein]-cysteine S-methyltransferase [Sinobacterium norvegicum]CAH0991385.1 DNA base-flipping protein [Sinobacterium norvegicum]